MIIFVSFDKTSFDNVQVVKSHLEVIQGSLFLLFLFLSQSIKKPLSKEWEDVEKSAANDDGGNNQHPILPSHRNDT